MPLERHSLLDIATVTRGGGGGGLCEGSIVCLFCVNLLSGKLQSH